MHHGSKVGLNLPGYALPLISENLTVARLCVQIQTLGPKALIIYKILLFGTEFSYLGPENLLFRTGFSYLGPESLLFGTRFSYLGPGGLLFGTRISYLGPDNSYMVPW